MDWEPTRLLCPWDSPGKNSGVSSHALLSGTFRGCHPALAPVPLTSFPSSLLCSLWPRHTDFHVAPRPASGPAFLAPVCWDALAQRAAWLARSPPHHLDSVGTTEAILLLHPPHSGHIQSMPLACCSGCLFITGTSQGGHTPQLFSPRPSFTAVWIPWGGACSALSTDIKNHATHTRGAQQPLAASPLSEPQTLDSKMREIIVTFIGPRLLFLGPEPHHALPSTIKVPRLWLPMPSSSSLPCRTHSGVCVSLVLLGSGHS